MLRSPKTRLILDVLLITTLTAVIFIVDTLTHREVAAAVFYAVVVLIAARIVNGRVLQVLAAVCIMLSVLSLLLTPGGQLGAGLINLGISIAAISVTTYLVLRMEKARAAAHAAQAHLTRMARASGLEGLTTSIAHEINQPLAAIITSGHAAQRWLAQQPPNIDRAGQALARMLDDAGRASAIIERVRSLTRGEPPRQEAFDVNAAVRDVVALSEAEMQRQHILWSLALAEDLPAALADRVQIQQVLGNLLLNAIEAISAADTSLRRIHMSTTHEHGTIRFTITDTGMGIPPGVNDHLFEAFWTTKPQGIGVGLSISRTIIEANHGVIQAETGQTGGAVFTFTLPAVSPADA